MENKNLEEAEKLANEHWAWLQALLEKIFRDAFTHGYKHGVEKKRSRRK